MEYRIFIIGSMICMISSAAVVEKKEPLARQLSLSRIILEELPKQKVSPRDNKIKYFDPDLGEAGVIARPKDDRSLLEKAAFEQYQLMNNRKDVIRKRSSSVSSAADSDKTNSAEVQQGNQQ